MNAITRFAFGTPVAEQRAAVAARPATALVGRVLLATLFILAGIQKFASYDQTLGYMEAQGLPWASGLLVLAALAEIGGGLSILTGFLTRIGALGLIVFLVITSLVFHDFWNLTGAERQTQMTSFLKNLSIMGGLALLVAYGAGRYSIDRGLRRQLHRR
jgi:putative oxidoreductase